MECALCHPRLGLAEVVETIVGDQAPGLIKCPHKGRLQGPFLSGCQVLLQLLQAGRAQGDRIPVGALQGKTARRHTLMPHRDPITHTPAQPRPCQDLGASICVLSPLAVSDSDPMDCRPPGSSVHGIFQAKVPEWVAISSSRVSFQLGD